MNKPFLSFILGIFMISFALAAGVSSEYWAGENANPLKMGPGESKEVNFYLQNMVGDQDLIFTATLIEGSNVTFLDGDKEYRVPVGTKDVAVPLIITIPEETPLGTKFLVKVDFNSRPVTTGTSPLAIGNAFGKSFEVIVGDIVPEEKKTNPMLFAIIGIVLIVIILFLIIKYNKNK